MNFSIQPLLENKAVILYPLQEADFEVLYDAASDPEIWAQHPNKLRWQKEVFRRFMDGAMESKGAFRVVEKASGKTVGSTRYYDYQPADNSILIGYTFYARSCWGKGINLGVKKMMLDYIFQFVHKVYFHIGAVNVRSQMAIARLGAVKTAEEEIPYYAEDPKLNYIYEISREQWLQQQQV